jgi:hypothetical protein
MSSKQKQGFYCLSESSRAEVEIVDQQKCAPKYNFVGNCSSCVSIAQGEITTTELQGKSRDFRYQSGYVNRGADFRTL